MEESNTENTSNSADASIISILRKAEGDGTLAEITKWQHVNLDELEKSLSALETLEDQLNLLQAEFICLYFYICDQKAISTAEFEEECKGYEPVTRLYIYYIFGYLVPLLQRLDA